MVHHILLSKTTTTHYKTHFIMPPNGGTEPWEGKSLAHSHVVGKGQSQGQESDLLTPNWCPVLHIQAPTGFYLGTPSNRPPTPSKLKWFVCITSAARVLSGHGAVRGSTPERTRG